MRIRRGISSRVLSCGCAAGVYETYSGAIVTVVDVRAEECVSGHREGQPVPDQPAPAAVRDPGYRE